ncbi:hypothetical protein DFJ74DRAFT_665514 [Hyaloraphidium curvatum]|nr:hypothetical protein DFJ74DRAFT_665514 [Hyaloraphidium curvatum]
MRCAKAVLVPTVVWAPESVADGLTPSPFHKLQYALPVAAVRSERNTRNSATLTPASFFRMVKEPLAVMGWPMVRWVLDEENAGEPASQ